MTALREAVGGRPPTQRSRAVLTSLIACAFVITACTGQTNPSSHPPSPPPPSPIEPVILDDSRTGLPQAMVMQAVTPRWGPGPDGPELLDDFGETRQLLEAGRRVVVLSEPVAGPAATTWVRVWVVPDPTVGLGDFVAWLPTTLAGAVVLRRVEAVACPAVATIATLTPLVPPDRLTCAGDRELVLDARSWLPVESPGYNTSPDWFGTNLDPAVINLFDPGPAIFGPKANRRPELAGAWIEARVPPDVARPPVGMYLRVTGRFDHPAASDCRRTGAFGAAGFGLPGEAATDSEAWCRWQFVLTAWDVLLGPEGRPLDPSAPQLHRYELQPDPGIPVGCGGVGMPPLTVRIDPTAVDPVWIETPGGGRSVAVFGPEFQLVLGDEPRVVATNGVMLANGEVIDPDRSKPGLELCPGGEVVTFDVGEPIVDG